MDVSAMGAYSKAWCPECVSTQTVKVLTLEGQALGDVRCVVSGNTWNVPGLAKVHDHEIDHTPDDHPIE